MPSARRPNVLVILSDQQRWDTVNCYATDPQPAIFDGLTPHLDAMAARGTRFQHAFTMQPVCGPARACLQTGRYATENGSVTNGKPLNPDMPHLADAMNEAGYKTGYIGKWHLAHEPGRTGTEPVPVERRGGYQHWLAADLLEFTSHGYEGYFFDTDNNRVDFEGYRPDRQTDFVLDYLRDHASADPNNDDKQPFFLFVSYIEPHHQNDLDRYIGPIGSKQRFADYRTPGDLVGTTPQPGARADWPLHMPDYLGCCWSLDQNVGRIRAELDLLGLAEDTVVIYSSDHGSHFCTRNGEYKRSCHEASIRVPMIACGPGFDGGQVRDELVSLIDLPATVIEAGGAKPMPKLRGRPLQKLVDGSAQDWGDDIFVQISETQNGRAVRTRRWKYCVTDAADAGKPGYDKPRDYTGARCYVEQYLYDLNADPYERHNLVADPSLKAVRAELADRIQRHRAEIGEPEATIEPAA